MKKEKYVQNPNKHLQYTEENCTQYQNITIVQYYEQYFVLKQNFTLCNKQYLVQ